MKSKKSTKNKKVKIKLTYSNITEFKPSKIRTDTKSNKIKTNKQTKTKKKSTPTTLSSNSIPFVPMRKMRSLTNTPDHLGLCTYKHLCFPKVNGRYWEMPFKLENKIQNKDKDQILFFQRPLNQPMSKLNTSINNGKNENVQPHSPPQTMMQHQHFLHQLASCSSYLHYINKSNQNQYNMKGQSSPQEKNSNLYGSHHDNNARFGKNLFSTLSNSQKASITQSLQHFLTQQHLYCRQFQSQHQNPLQKKSIPIDNEWKAKLMSNDNQFDNHRYFKPPETSPWNYQAITKKTSQQRLSLKQLEKREKD